MTPIGNASSASEDKGMGFSSNVFCSANSVVGGFAVTGVSVLSIKLDGMDDGIVDGVEDGVGDGDKVNGSSSSIDGETVGRHDGDVEEKKGLLVGEMNTGESPQRGKRASRSSHSH
jgi:hypothetical protein